MRQKLNYNCEQRNAKETRKMSSKTITIWYYNEQTFSLSHCRLCFRRVCKYTFFENAYATLESRYHSVTVASYENRNNKSYHVHQQTVLNVCC